MLVAFVAPVKLDIDCSSVVAVVELVVEEPVDCGAGAGVGCGENEVAEERFIDLSESSRSG